MKKIRPYSNYSLSMLFRIRSFFFYCSFPSLIRNSYKNYNRATRILGKKAVNRLIHAIYGDIFIGGENTTDLEKYTEKIKKCNMISVIQYALEFLTEEEEKVINFL